jgi:hypothetical protein
MTLFQSNNYLYFMVAISNMTIEKAEPRTLIVDVELWKTCHGNFLFTLCFCHGNFLTPTDFVKHVTVSHVAHQY